MHRNTSRALAVALAVAVAAVACSSSKSKSTTQSSSSGGGSSQSSVAGGGKTFTVGVLYDITGLASNGQKHTEDGVKAGIAVVKKDGYNMKYVVADTQSTPGGALSAAQHLVQQDQVLAVIAHSAVTFGAAAYLTQRGIPVIGPAEDAAEWITSKNMFPVYGALHTEKVNTTAGKFLKMQGGTTYGGAGLQHRADLG